MGEQVSATDILSDPDVVAAMRLAYQESDVGGGNPVEQGGFVLRNPASGNFEVARLPAGQRDSLCFPVCADGMYNGKEIVGSFHTHPNTGQEWRQEPSPQDIRLSQDYPETMGPHQFIISHETIFHIDNDGAVSEIGGTNRLLQIRQEDIT